MKAPRALIATLAAILAAAIAAAAAPAPRNPAIGPDHGRFRIMIHGHAVGTEDFTVSRDGAGWSASSHIQLELPGQKDEQDTADLTLAADGFPVRYHWLGQAAEVRTIDLVFRDRTAEVTLRRPGSPPAVETFSFPPGVPVVLLDNNVYEQYAILARLYDWKTGGKQKFSVLIPQDQVPGTVTVESAGVRAVEGKPLNLLIVKSPDLEVDLYVDSARRLWIVRVPNSGAEIVRE